MLGEDRPPADDLDGVLPVITGGVAAAIMREAVE
jgi:hypothetical protein